MGCGGVTRGAAAPIRSEGGSRHTPTMQWEAAYNLLEIMDSSDVEAKRAQFLVAMRLVGRVPGRLSELLEEADYLEDGLWHAESNGDAMWFAWTTESASNDSWVRGALNEILEMYDEDWTVDPKDNETHLVCQYTWR